MKYKKIKQKPYCCVGACMEMILKRNNIFSYNQDYIVDQLGLIIPFGTQIEKEEYSINNFFKTNNIPLIQEYFYLTKENEIIDLLSKNNDFDIMICFNYQKFYNLDKDDFGHMVLFISLKQRNLTVLDPYKNSYEKRNIKDLIKAILKHGINNGAGFYIIKHL